MSKQVKITNAQIVEHLNTLEDAYKDLYPYSADKHPVLAFNEMLIEKLQSTFFQMEALKKLLLFSDPETIRKSLKETTFVYIKSHLSDDTDERHEALLNFEILDTFLVDLKNSNLKNIA